MAGIAAQESEGFVHVGTGCRGDGALGLLQDGPGVEGLLHLLGDLLALVDEALMEDADGGHVGHGLGNSLIGLDQAVSVVAPVARRGGRRSSVPHGK